VRDLRLRTVGRIVAGIDEGRFVEILDDWESSGGFLIMTYGQPDRSGEGFDAWVESIIDVDLYFDEAGWEIEWLSC
jgi:hypothetical protein